MRVPIDRTDQLIDEIVYDLYGLSEVEIAIVEDAVGGDYPIGERPLICSIEGRLGTAMADHGSRYARSSNPRSKSDMS
ncbi:MAG: hypothetical protein ACQETB_09895 [Halobacteriota archaeon]